MSIAERPARRPPPAGAVEAAVVEAVVVEAVVLPPNSRAAAVAPRRFSRWRLLRLWTLDYYLARSFLLAYAVCTLVFMGFYVLVEAFFKLNKFLPASAHSPLEIAGIFVRSLFEYHLAMVPTVYVNYMGPVITLAAAMFTLTFLNRGNEFTAVKASGISIYRVLLPIFVLAVAFSGATFALAEWVLPQLREPIRKAIAISRSGLLRPDGVYDPVYDLHIQVRHYYPDSKIAEGVLIRHWTLSPKGQREEKLFVDAERMVWMPEPGAETRLERGRWRLFNGSMQRWDPGGNLMVNAKEKGFDHLKRPFAEHDLETSLVPIDLETSDQDVSYLSWRELRAQYQRQPQDKSLLVKLHHHFAFPLSHLVLLLLGIPFVLNFHSRSLVLGLAACFFLAAGYFLMGSMAVSLASDPGNPLLPPVIAAWLPNVLFGSLGLTVFTNLRS